MHRDTEGNDQGAAPDDRGPGWARLSRQSFLRGSLAGAAALAAGLSQAELTAAHEEEDPPPPVGGGTSSGPVKAEWLGWSHFRFTTPSGKIILTNPWLTNPDSPVKLDDITQADLILAPDGHQDEIGQTLEIVAKTGAKVFAPGELQSWFLEQGLPPASILQRFAAPGDRLQFLGNTLYMLTSIHGSGLPRPTAQNPYGGIAVSYMLVFENNFRVYFGASTAAMGDQALWAELYQPHLAILHGGINHAPTDMALQVRLLAEQNPHLTAVWLHHLRAAPPANQTNIAETRAILEAWKLDVTVDVPKIGQVYELRPGAHRRPPKKKKK